MNVMNRKLEANKYLVHSYESSITQQTENLLKYLGKKPKHKRVDLSIEKKFRVTFTK